MDITAKHIITFWFQTIEPKSWWIKDETFDQKLMDEFGEIHHQATQGELWHWRDTPHGRLAEIIVLDQFSRNIYRDTAKAFLYDPMALVLAQEAIQLQINKQLSGKELSFLYMPFMHSESLVIHQQALKLFAEPGLEGNVDFEQRHYDIIKRFSRYPHRNKILNRQSTSEEIEFLEQPGSSF